jgi:hypothetical protein
MFTLNKVKQQNHCSRQMNIPKHLNIFHWVYIRQKVSNHQAAEEFGGREA